MARALSHVAASAHAGDVGQGCMELLFRTGAAELLFLCLCPGLSTRQVRAHRPKVRNHVMLIFDALCREKLRRLYDISSYSTCGLGPSFHAWQDSVHTVLVWSTVQ